MFAFKKFADTQRGQPVRVVLPEGYMLSTAGTAREGGVVFGFINPEDFAASKTNRYPRQTLPLPIPTESPSKDQTQQSSPSIARRSPSPPSSAPHSASFHSSAALSVSSASDSDRLMSSVSAPSTAIFPLQEGYAPAQSPPPDSTAIFPLPKVDAPPPKPSVTPPSTAVWSTVMRESLTAKLSSIGNTVLSATERHSHPVFLVIILILVRVPYLLMKQDEGGSTAKLPFR